MSTKILAVASLCLIGFSGAAFADDRYSHDMSVDSNGTAPYKIQEKSKIDYDKTGSVTLPSCASEDAMSAPNKGVHSRGGDSGASRTDACRDDSN